MDIKIYSLLHKNLKKYVEDNLVISSCSGGCSDITLQHKKTGRYIFMTCKYTLTDKPLEYYDVKFKLLLSMLLKLK